MGSVGLLLFVLLYRVVVRYYQSAFCSAPIVLLSIMIMILYYRLHARSCILLFLLLLTLPSSTHALASSALPDSH